MANPRDKNLLIRFLIADISAEQSNRVQCHSYPMSQSRRAFSFDDLPDGAPRQVAAIGLLVLVALFCDPGSSSAAEGAPPIAPEEQGMEATQGTAGINAIESGLEEVWDEADVDAYGAEEPNSISMWPSIRWSTEWFGYYRESSSGGDQHLFRSDLQFNFQGNFASDFSYTLTPQVRVDSGNNGTNRFEFREDGHGRPLATFREANIGWSSSAFELNIGKKIFNWGVADAWNPIDDLNPWDYLIGRKFDFLGAERDGGGSISAWKSGWARMALISDPKAKIFPRRAQ